MAKIENEYRDYDFLSSDLDMEKVEENIHYLNERMNLKEILKVVREISYDMVCYYDEDSKGLIYHRDRSKLNREQACNLQRKLATACDLFLQSMQGMEFDYDYLKERLGR